MSPVTRILLFGLGLGLVAEVANFYILLAFHEYYIELCFIAPFIALISLFGLIFRLKPNPEKTPIGVWIMLIVAFLAGALNYYITAFTEIPERIFGPFVSYQL